MSKSTVSNTSIEQKIQSFMMNEFHPKRMKLTSQEISKQLSGFFMMHSGENGKKGKERSFLDSPLSGVSTPLISSLSDQNQEKIVEKGDEKRVEKPKNQDFQETDKEKTKNHLKPKREKSESKTDTLFLDKNSWGFWSAYVFANGFEKYSEIPKSERIKFAIQEKTKISEWLVSDFKQTKSVLSDYFYRLNNRDLEEIATGLMTDADEHKVGLEVLVLVSLYYRCTAGDAAASSKRLGNRLVWCFPSKKVYFPITLDVFSGSENHIVLDIEDNTSNKKEVKKPAEWGIFVSEKEEREGSKRKPEKMYTFRRLVERDWESIEKDMIRLAHVNKALQAQTKYTMSDLTAMANSVGIRPPIRELDEKEMELDLAKRVRSSEKKAVEDSLGIRRKSSAVKSLMSEEAVEKRCEEKWKKADWYGGLEEYLAGIF